MNEAKGAHATALRSYEDRLPEFKKVKERICSILLDYPCGLTVDQITLRYIERFHHVARIDNRLRDLRREGEVESYPNSKGLLTWKLTDKWNFSKK